MVDWTALQNHARQGGSQGRRGRTCAAADNCPRRKCKTTCVCGVVCATCRMKAKGKLTRDHLYLSPPATPYLQLFRHGVAAHSTLNLALLLVCGSLITTITISACSFSSSNSRRCSCSSLLALRGVRKHLAFGRLIIQEAFVARQLVTLLCDFSCRA